MFPKVRREALTTLLNLITVNQSDEQLLMMLEDDDYRLIDVVLETPTLNDTYLLINMMEAIEKMLTLDQAYRVGLSVQIEKRGGYEKIEELTQHQFENVRKAAEFTLDSIKHMKTDENANYNRPAEGAQFSI